MASRVSCGVLEIQISLDMLLSPAAGLPWRAADAADQSGSDPAPGIPGRIRLDGGRAGDKKSNPKNVVKRDSLCERSFDTLRPEPGGAPPKGSAEIFKLAMIARLSGRKEFVTTSA
jgi:hypothetical protein